MKLSLPIKIFFILLTILALHPTVTPAQQSDKSAPSLTTFDATPDNDLLLRHSQALKNEYRNKLVFLPKQERLNEQANIHCILGDIGNVTRKFGEAKDAYREAESCYKETGNFLGLGRVWYGRGELNRKLNRYDDAEDAYKQATHYYERANSYQGRAAVQLALGHIKKTTVGPEEARNFYEYAGEIYGMKKSRLGEANVFCALGDLEYSLGKYEAAEKAYDKATSIYGKKNNLLGLANVLIGLGNLARARNDNSNALASALELYEKAAGHYKSIQDDFGRANALTGMAHTERELSAQYHWENSSNHYVVALELYKENKDIQGQANVLTGQGYLETLRGNYEKAEKNDWSAKRYYEMAKTNYLSAKRYYEDIGDNLGQANVVLGLGRLEVIQGKLHSALKKCIQAENIYRALNNLLGLANALTERGHLQSMLGKTKEDRILSLNTYKEAKKLYSDLKNRLGEAHVLCGIGFLEKKWGHLKEAENAFDDAGCLYGQLQNYQGKQAASQFLKEIEKDEKLAKTDAVKNNHNNKENIAARDTQDHEWLLSGLGPWIADKLCPFIGAVPGKLWQLAKMICSEIGVIIVTIITLISTLIKLVLKK
ncbi:hypothetical protein KKHLCK_13220 [Candidatus Electrothrix laxa]